MKSRLQRLLPDSSHNSQMQRALIKFPEISIMWPDGRPEAKQIVRKETGWDIDLRLDDLVQSMTLDRRYSAYIHQILLSLTTDTGVIEWRQAILEDFLSNPTLTDMFSELLPRMQGLGQRSTALLGRRERGLLLEASDRLAELDLYTETVVSMLSALKQAHLSSPGLIQLLRELEMLQNSESFRNLQDQLPEMRAPFSKIASLTVGINLDAQLRPRSAVLMAVNDVEIGEPASFLERLVGIRDSEVDESGIAPMHHVPGEKNQRILSPLFQDLNRLMNQIAQPVTRELQRYTWLSSEPLIELEFELAFFVGAARMVERLRDRGVSFCRPEIRPSAAREMVIEDLTNIALALSEEKHLPVTSDVRFDESGRIGILTGPNSGGKTTYLQAVGLTQAMFQAGLNVPAKLALMSPVRTILTHFPALETRRDGRLAEEASRLRRVFTFADAHSLILLNETFSSTSASEAIYLARDILSAMRIIGLRALYATHFSELVEHIDQIEENVSGSSRIFSLVAGIDTDEKGESVATYRVVRGMPLGRSYARQIALRYGISLDQIMSNQVYNNS